MFVSFKELLLQKIYYIANEWFIANNYKKKRNHKVNEYSLKHHHFGLMLYDSNEHFTNVLCCITQKP